MKLLVTTDFSTNSKAALRFARDIANLSSDIEVTFYHAVHFLKPTKWSDTFFDNYQKDETERLTLVLKNFVKSAYVKSHPNFKRISYVIDSAISIEKDIISFAKKHNFDGLCIATKGAGILRKIVGTNTSYIVQNSTVPVFVVPSHYKSKPIKDVTYMSDLEKFKQETEVVTQSLSPLHLEYNIVHFAGRFSNPKFIEKAKSLLAAEPKNNLELKVLKRSVDYTLIETITNFIKRTKVDLLILFSNKDRNLFETIFSPSKTAELTYTTRVPILVFAK